MLFIIWPVAFDAQIGSDNPGIGTAIRKGLIPAGGPELAGHGKDSRIPFLDNR